MLSLRVPLTKYLEVSHVRENPFIQFSVTSINNGMNFNNNFVLFNNNPKRNGWRVKMLQNILPHLFVIESNTHLYSHFTLQMHCLDNFSSFLSHKTCQVLGECISGNLKLFFTTTHYVIFHTTYSNVIEIVMGV